MLWARPSVQRVYIWKHQMPTPNRTEHCKCHVIFGKVHQAGKWVGTYLGNVKMHVKGKMGEAISELVLSL